MFFLVRAMQGLLSSVRSGILNLVAQWYPLPFFAGSGFPYKVTNQEKGPPYYNMVTGLLRFVLGFLSKLHFRVVFLAFPHQPRCKSRVSGAGVHLASAGVFRDILENSQGWTALGTTSHSASSRRQHISSSSSPRGFGGCTTGGFRGPCTFIRYELGALDGFYLKNL